MNLNRVAATLSGLVLACGATSLIVVGCGGDDTNGGGADSGRDVTVDTNIDVNSPDTGSDGPSTVDAGPDGDASDGALLPDVQPAQVGEFPAQVLTALCESIRRCCDTSFGREAGAFDLNRCINTQGNVGGFKNISNHTAALQGDSGALVAYDTAKAGKCLQDIATFTCPPPAQTALEYQTARDDCYAALKGTIALNGTGCTDDIHCAAGHCVGGTCVALVGDGGACQTSDDCAYRGTSTPNVFCNADGTQDGGICVPRLDLDGGCGNFNDFDYAACTSGLCDPASGLCSATDPFVDPGTCDVFTIQDAGPG